MMKFDVMRWGNHPRSKRWDKFGMLVHLFCLKCCYAKNDENYPFHHFCPGHDTAGRLRANRYGFTHHANDNTATIRQRQADNADPNSNKNIFTESPHSNTNFSHPNTPTGRGITLCDGTCQDRDFAPTKIIRAQRRTWQPRFFIRWHTPGVHGRRWHHSFMGCCQRPAKTSLAGRICFDERPGFFARWAAAGLNGRR